MTDTPTRTQVVSAENAVFWIDGEGRWHNEHGPFENPKISAYFHACIHKDAGGFHLRQQRDGVLEKVYFRAEDTALFVFRVNPGPPVSLILNTGRVLRLDPEALFIRNDRLYLTDGGDRIKFTTGAAMKLAPYLLEEGGKTVFTSGGARTPVREI